MISVNRSRLVSLVSASTIFATMVLTAATPAFAGSVPKTTGDVWANRTSDGLGMAHMVFVAQGTSPAKGTFTYSDAKGSYTIAVQAANVEGSVAHFAGPIVSNTYPGFDFGFVSIAVRDGGEPGVVVDKVNGAGYESLDAAVAGFSSLSPDFLPVSAGNLQVHDHS